MLAIIEWFYANHKTYYKQHLTFKLIENNWESGKERRKKPESKKKVHEQQPKKYQLLEKRLQEEFRQRAEHSEEVVLYLTNETNFKWTSSNWNNI